MGQSFQCFEALDSTNTYLKAQAAELPDGAAVLAKHQTAGKGRLGRQWSQAGGENLAFSLLLHDVDITGLSVLPLIAGLAAATALESLCGERVWLKWSNDVLISEKKLAGILCESRISGGCAYAVAGIGVNLTQDQEDFDRLGLVYATSMKLATGKFFEVLPVAYTICNRFEPLLMEFRKNGFAAIRDDYKSRCLTLGRAVRVLDGNSEYKGTAVDIAVDGSLVCETETGVVSVQAGEVSVRGIYGYV